MRRPLPRLPPRLAELFPLSPLETEELTSHERVAGMGPLRPQPRFGDGRVVQLTEVVLERGERFRMATRRSVQDGRHRVERVAQCLGSDAHAMEPVIRRRVGHRANGRPQPSPLPASSHDEIVERDMAHMCRHWTAGEKGGARLDTRRTGGECPEHLPERVTTFLLESLQQRIARGSIAVGQSRHQRSETVDDHIEIARLPADASKLPECGFGVRDPRWIEDGLEHPKVGPHAPDCDPQLVHFVHRIRRRLRDDVCCVGKRATRLRQGSTRELDYGPGLWALEHCEHIAGTTGSAQNGARVVQRMTSLTIVMMISNTISRTMISSRRCDMALSTSSASIV